jgi:poly-gamma-glutamate synthesis protein (capsule biosynthesis protein)
MQRMKSIPLLLALLWTGVATAAPAVKGEVNLVFVGDIMVAETPGELIAKGIDPFKPFESYLDAQDLRIGNLECVIATTGKAEVKPFTFRADPITIPVLAKHFDGLSLANNHSGDFGKDAFAEQLALLRKAGLPYFGGGDNATEAHAPWIVERNGLRIALLGYVEYKPRSFEASATRPGVAWSGEDDQVINDIIDARKVHGADLVIPFMHWGWEDEPQPSPRLREFSQRMLDAGADLVVGSHPHVTQGAEYYKGKLIVYSLGNFLFNGFDTPATTTGWVLKVRMDKDGMKEWETRVARLDDDGVPHPDLKASSPCGKAGDTVIAQCTGGQK